MQALAALEEAKAELKAAQHKVAQAEAHLEKVKNKGSEKVHGQEQGQGPEQGQEPEQEQGPEQGPEQGQEQEPEQEQGPEQGLGPELGQGPEEIQDQEQEQGTEIITQQKSEKPAIKFYEHLIHLIEKLMAEKKSILQEISKREKEIQHVRKAFEQLHQHARITMGF